MGVSPWKVGLLFFPYEMETDIGVFFAWIAGGRAVFGPAIRPLGILRTAFNGFLTVLIRACPFPCVGPPPLRFAAVGGRFCQNPVRKEKSGQARRFLCRGQNR